MTAKRDLFVVVADLDAENTIKTLLGKRQPSLGIKIDFSPLRPPQGDLLRYSGRDSGCYKDAVDLLRPPLQTHHHALLCFDWHGSGAESKPPKETESEVEALLAKNGWSNGTAAVVVIAPELEAWVWADSPHVAEVLGWKDDAQGLRSFLHGRELWTPGFSKPNDPKIAMDQALRAKRKPGGARLFSDLASQVTLNQCRDPAFQKLQQTLQRWFPAQDAQDTE